jgi:hypothetical protein
MAEIAAPTPRRGKLNILPTPRINKELSFKTSYFYTCGVMPLFPYNFT